VVYRIFVAGDRSADHGSILPGRRWRHIGTGA
jgi:hypothetical protein